MGRLPGCKLILMLVFLSLHVQEATSEDDADPECLCSCTKLELPTSEEELQNLGEEEATRIKKELIVDTTHLSATVRKKTSADDQRPVAKNMGYMGVAMLVLAASLIFAMDSTYIIQGVHSLATYCKHKSA